jgi:HemY protein
VKILLPLLLIPILLLAGGIYAYREMVAAGNPGYLIIGFGSWSIETSLFLGLVGLALGFVALYLAIRLVINTVRLPTILKQRGGAKRSQKSQEALIAGLLESAEGNWEKAERNLIRHAANSGVPLINYLTAARAAQSRGAYDQRDEYLNLARETMPEAELAIGLTRAELQLSDRQFNEALESLTQLDQLAPSHAKVLKMLHQAYAQLEDWEGIRKLIPKLHANKVMLEAEIRLLETDTYNALLKRKAETKDAGALRDAWLDVPEHIRALPGIQHLYFAAMIEAGAGVEIEPRLRQLIEKERSDTLLVLYSCIQLPDPAKQLELAERWQSRQETDPVLLRVLGKLALRAQQIEKARSYVQASLDREPSVEAYRLMGDVLLQQNQPNKACLFFRNGLLFAANEAVAQIDLDGDGVGDLPAATAAGEEPLSAGG